MPYPIQHVGERMVRVEEQVIELREKADRMEAKLDELLALRNKGLGAFWLATSLMGTGIIGAVIAFLRYIGVK
jgi:hypothetical protein